MTCSCGEAEQNAAPEKRGAAPPPSQSGPAVAVACTRAAIDDAETKALFPAESAGFCLDPKDGGKALGEGTKNALEGIADLFDGESKIYEDHGVMRVVQVHYVAKAGGSATVDIVLSKFAEDSGAYGMFTKRVVGDGDPKDPATPKPFPAGGVAALGTGAATMWKGRFMVELVFNDDSKSPAEIEREGKAVLEPFAQAIGAALSGDTKPPASVIALPEAGRVPLGVRLLMKGALPGVATSPGGAVGYYDEQGKRYRVVVIDAADDEKAKDLLRGVAGASPLPGIADQALRAEVKEATAAGEMVVARKGSRVVGVVDELRVFGGKSAATTLSTDEKKAKLSALFP